MIDRLPVREIKPTWEADPANRFVAHDECNLLAYDHLRIAFVQIKDEPDVVYVITEQELPKSIDHAIQVVSEWRLHYG